MQRQNKKQYATSSIENQLNVSQWVRVMVKEARATIQAK
jgi:hypothetical protein